MDLEFLAAQLRKPVGEAGVQIGEVMNNGNSLLNKQAIEILNLKQEDKVLEIGLGNGYFVKDILETHPTITFEGIDYSETMIDEAKRINKFFIENRRANFILGTADKLPYPGNSFSKILTINTIYFWGNASKELAEIKRVLRPEGLFVIGIRSKKTMEQMPFTKFGFVKYNLQDLSDILTTNNFKIVKVKEQLEPPYNFNDQIIQLENIIITCTK